jgi:hypothetical protein
MVYLNGPSRGVSRARLHDAPPGYRPPRRRLPVKERRRKARRDWILMRVTSLVLIPLAVAVVVIIIVMIATHA